MFPFPRWLPDRPSLDSCESGSFSRVVSPLRSSFVTPPGRPLSGRPLLPGFRPSSRRHWKRPRTTRASGSRCVPSSGFLNLATACSASSFAGLFHPAATSRVSPSRGFSRPAAAPIHHRRLAPLPLPTDDSPALPPAAIVERFDFEALLYGPERSSGLELTSPSAAPLFGFRPPPGSTHPPWPTAMWAIRSGRFRRGLPSCTRHADWPFRASSAC